MPYSKTHKERSKARIIQSATELFCRYGFDKVTIGQIMQLAKLTHGAFYAHFESKEALYSASFLDILRSSRVARLVKGPLSVKHLTALVTHYWNLREAVQRNRPGPETILFNELGTDNPEIRKLFESSYENIRRMLEKRIIALGKLKQIPFNEGREAAGEKSRAILASLVGAVAIAKSIPQEEERQRILEAAQKQILLTLGVTEMPTSR